MTALSVSQLGINLGASAIELWDASNAASLAQSGGVAGNWTGVINGTVLTPFGNPTYSATGIAGLKPAAVMNGASQYFEKSGTVPRSAPTGTEDGWIFALAQNNASDNVSRWAFGYGSAAANGARGIDVLAQAGTKRIRANRGSGGVVDTTSGINAAGLHILSAQFQAGGSNVGTRIDGNAGTIGASSFSTGTGKTRIGASAQTAADSFWNGSIALVLITTALTADQINTIEGVFNAYAQGQI